MRNVAFVAPFPIETTMRFARALRGLDGVRMLGIVHDPPGGSDAGLYDDVVRVADPLDPRQLALGARELVRRHGPIHRITGILEPLQVPIAAIREDLGIDGMDVHTAELFRDKARMKDALRAAGLPCARHALAARLEDAERFVRDVGFPVVLKPPAGMACKATWRIDDAEALRQAMAAMAPSDAEPVLVEEFLRGREHSFETITVGGEVKLWSLSRYEPSCLEVMQNPWIQWVVVLPRDVSGPEFADARELGLAAVRALGLRTGFTHMEWFRKGDGSLAIGEIAARPPGAQFVRLTGLCHDADLYRAWARAIVDEAFDGPWERRWSAGCAYLRGMGRGRVVATEGLDRAQELVGPLVVEAKLPAFGAPKSDSYEGDGYVIVRDHDEGRVRAALRTIIETVRVRYG
jgi:formate-dependent phosphoribosylglycinamide formyltransferase (GAR transformylase)